MRDGKHCPACGVDIGVWSIFSAGLPNLIRCPKCKARLAYQDTSAFIIASLVAMGAGVFVALGVAYLFEGRQQFLIAFIAILLGLWVPVELAIAFYLRSKKLLEVRSGGTPPTLNGDDPVMEARPAKTQFGKSDDANERQR